MGYTYGRKPVFMATIVDLLRQLGHRAGPGGSDALSGPIAIPARPLPALGVALPPRLVESWSRMTGRRTGAQHALGIAASRSEQPVAFVGPGQVPTDDLALVVAAQLAADPRAVALWLAPDEPTARAFGRSMGTLVEQAGIAWCFAGQPPARDGTARLVIATYDDLHNRLLRFADRGWRRFWHALWAVALPDLHEVSGSRGHHLTWLLRRATRLAAHNLRLLASLSPIAQPDAVLEQLFGRSARLIEAEVSRPESSLVALWRSSRRHEAAEALSRELAGRKLAITLLGHDAASHALLAQTPSPFGSLTSLPPSVARIAIVTGVPRSAPERAALLARGYRLVVMLAADEPHEAYFAADPARLLESAPHMPVPALNPYIATLHLEAAVAERELTVAEVETWNVLDLAARLSARHVLRPVAAGFHAGDAARHPSPSLAAAFGVAEPVVVRDPRGAQIAWLPASIADWRGLPGTTWSPGLIVASRTEDPPVVDLAAADDDHVAHAALSLELTVREEGDQRSCRVGDRSFEVGYARLQAQQRVDGLVSYTPGRPARRLPLPRPAESVWNALGFFVALPEPPQDRASAGWALLQALPHVLISRVEEVVGAYDPQRGRLWLVETEPGGIGLALAIFTNAEALLEAARDIARAMLASPLWGALARSELGWLDQRGVEPPVDLAAPAPSPAPSHAVSLPPAPQAAASPRRTRIYAPIPFSPEPVRRVSSEEQIGHDTVEPETEPLQPAIPWQPRLACRYEAPASPPPYLEQVDLPAGDRAGSRDNLSGSADQSDALHVATIEAMPDSGVDEQADAPPPLREAPVDWMVRSAHAEPDATAQQDLLPDREDVEPDTIEDLLKRLPPLDDVVWTADAAELDAPIRDVTWAPGSDQLALGGTGPVHERDDELDDITWDAERQPQPPDDQARPPLPLLGRESPRPLNAPRHPSRYSSPRPQASGPIPRQRREPPPERASAPRPDQEQAAAASPEAETLPTGPVGGQPPRPPERAVDVGAMIARMRRLREEREREQPPETSSAVQPASAPSERFHPGQRVTCVPYGEGTVRDARVIDGRERLTIGFPDAGEIMVDPAVNVVREVEEDTSTSDDQADWSG